MSITRFSGFGVCLVFAIAGRALGQALESEPFEYPEGFLAGNGDWEGVATHMVDAGSLVIGDWATSGNHISYGGTPGPSSPISVAANDLFKNDGTGGTIYISTILRNNVNFYLRRDSGTGPQYYNMQLDGGGVNANNGTPADTGQSLGGMGANNLVLWVTRIIHDGGPGADTVDYWIRNQEAIDASGSIGNPGILIEEPVDWTPTATAPEDWNTDSDLFWRPDTANGGAGDEIRRADEFRIADSWLGVYSDLMTGPPSRDHNWQTASGDWNGVGNFSNGVPNDNEQTAIFGDQVQSGPSGITAFTNDPVTVRAIRFDNANTVNVAGLGHVNVESGSVAQGINAAIDVLQGDHQFQAPVNVNSTADLGIASGASLEFVNRLNLNGNTVTMPGEGSLIISNTLNTGGGTLNVTGGVVGGGGTVGGDLNNNGGMISPGNSAAAGQIPEPTTIVLLTLGGLLLALCGKRRPA